MSTRLDEDTVQAAVGPLSAKAALDLLDDPTRAALALVDTLTSDEPQVSAQHFAALKDHFGDDQILELGAALSVASGWQRFIEAFGIRPDGWAPSDPQREDSP